jgi:hypothetical protein
VRGGSAIATVGKLHVVPGVVDLEHVPGSLNFLPNGELYTLSACTWYFYKYKNLHTPSVWEDHRCAETAFNFFHTETSALRKLQRNTCVPHFAWPHGEWRLSYGRRRTRPMIDRCQDRGSCCTPTALGCCKKVKSFPLRVHTISHFLTTNTRE